MGCLINYATGDGVLRAVVTGRSTQQDAAWIARDIAEQAGRQRSRQVLIDVRRLADRVGTLGMLSLAVGAPGEIRGYRVAVVDAIENDAYYALHEVAAQARGYVLRCFTSAGAAAKWLRAAPATSGARSGA